MKSRSHGQLTLGPAPVENLSSEQSEVKKVSDDAVEVKFAAELFDAALTGARISSTEVAIILGVSEAMVSKWRSPNYRDCPSFLQMLRLPPGFQFELIAAWYRRQGFGKAVLARVLDSIGLLSLSVGER